MSDGGSGSGSGSAQYTPGELQLIREEFTSGKTPMCPRCVVAMTRREIGGGSAASVVAARSSTSIAAPGRKGTLFFSLPLPASRFRFPLPASRPFIDVH